MPAEDFPYDVFLSHSSKDKAVVLPLAERLRQDGLQVWFDEWELLVASVYDRRSEDRRSQSTATAAKIEEGLECSRLLVLCMSANTFGSDWAQLESGTFRFREPLNQELRSLPFASTPTSSEMERSLFNLLDIRSRHERNHL